MLAALLCNIGATPVVVNPPTGGKGDNPPQTRGTFKPTGLLDRPVKKQKIARTEQPGSILAIEEVSQPVTHARQAPSQMMSLAEIDFEIKYLMTKLYRTQDEEDILIILLIASNS